MAARGIPFPVSRRMTGMALLLVFGGDHAIAPGSEAEKLCQNIKQWAADLAFDPALLEAILRAAEAPPADYVQKQGWVLIAFRNALW